MAEDNSWTKRLDVFSKVFSVISLAIAVISAVAVLPYDAKIKSLQADASKQEIALKEAEATLKSLESDRKMTMELYQEVKKVLVSKERNPREEEALRVLVESLAEDPLRWKLLNVLATGATSPDVKEAAAQSAKFYQEDAQAAPTADSDSTGAYNIDFFYCEEKKATSLPLARKAASIRNASDKGRWRVRLLPNAINQHPGYNISSNLIRFSPPEEKPIALNIKKRLHLIGLELGDQETAHPTPGYVSVFVCQ